MITNH